MSTGSNLARLRTLSEKLEETESALSAFWHLAPILLIVSRRSGEILKINMAWKYMLGYDTEDVVGKLGRDFVHPDDAGKTAAARELAFQQGYLKDFRHRWRKKDGAYTTLNWNSTLIHSNAYIYGVATEVCGA